MTNEYIIAILILLLFILIFVIISWQYKDDIPSDATLYISMSTNLKNSDDVSYDTSSDNIIIEPLQDDPMTHEKHDDDAQNVHNNTIILSVIKKYDQLKKLVNLIHDENLIDATFANINDYVTAKSFAVIHEIYQKAHTQFSDEQLQKISKYLEILLKHKDYIIAKFNLSELNLTALIWLRIHQAENAHIMNKLEEAFFDQVFDMVRSDGIPVCEKGRILRLFSCLTLLDVDPILSTPELDDHELANLAYAQAHNILERELSRANMREIYLNSEELSIEEKTQLTKFVENTRTLVAQELENKYAGLIQPSKLRIIIDRAQSGIE